MEYCGVWFSRSLSNLHMTQLNMVVIVDGLRLASSLIDSAQVRDCIGSARAACAACAARKASGYKHRMLSACPAQEWRSAGGFRTTYSFYALRPKAD
jgi:hypothetical protein